MMMIIIIITTSGQRNLTTGRIAAAYRRFNSIRQVVTVCIPPNTCFFGLTRVHNPNGISIDSAIFAQLTAECRQECQGMSLSLKTVLSHGAIWTSI